MPYRLAPPVGCPTALARLDRYQPVLRLGAGGLADAFLATTRVQPGADRLVVIKTLLPHLTSDPVFRDRFLHQAQFAAQLDHPDLVETLEVGLHEGRPAMVMEYIHGVTLQRARRTRQAGSPMPLAMQVRVLCSALSALHHIHGLRDESEPHATVHGQLSPGEILVTYDGQVRVMPGLYFPSPRSSHGLLKGMLHHLAPEQIQGRPLDGRADVFAVGLMLLTSFCAHGTHLLEPSRTTGAPLPSLREAAPDAPGALVAIAERALAPDPADRYPTALAMQADLEAFLRQHPPVTSSWLGQHVAGTFAEERLRQETAIAESLRQLIVRR